MLRRIAFFKFLFFNRVRRRKKKKKWRGKKFYTYSLIPSNAAPSVRLCDVTPNVRLRTPFKSTRHLATDYNRVVPRARSVLSSSRRGLGKKDASRTRGGEKTKNKKGEKGEKPFVELRHKEIKAGNVHTENNPFQPFYRAFGVYKGCF